MILDKNKSKASLMRRRKRWIIALSVSLAVLVAFAIAVAYFVSIVTYVDVDGEKYQIKFKDGVYALYKDGELVYFDEEAGGYYVTDAGTLLKIDKETGSYEVVAVVDTEGSETVGVNNAVLLFEAIRKDSLRSIEVHNPNGSFKFHRFNLQTGLPDDSSDFVIESAPGVDFDKELFTALYVDTGYTLSMYRITDPIKDEKGELSEYGLVSETRVDGEGNEYNYEPAYYIITDLNGNSHKVIVGDLMVDGTGYYVQYVALTPEGEVKRDTVYVLEKGIENTILAEVEDFATPKIVYPMQMNDYFDVEKFTVMQYDKNGGFTVPVIFTYIDLEERENKIEATEPYILNHNSLDGYMANSENIGIALNYLLETEFERVVKLAPTDVDLESYGMAKIEGDVINMTPAYSIAFYFDVVDDDGNKVETIWQELYISEKNEDGNYYVYTMIYEGHPDTGKDEEFLYSLDMIVEVKGHCLDFVTWGKDKWVSKSYVNLNIAFCREITIKTPEYEAFFALDNSASNMANGINSEYLTVHGKDNKGNDIKTFSKLTKTDIYGNVWTVSEGDITVVDRNGKSIEIEEGGYNYAYNKLGKNVKVLTGVVYCDDGSELRVTADAVTVKKGTDTTTYVRFATGLFRLFYQTLVSATLEDSYPMSEEEQSALVSDADKWQLTMTVKDSNGKVYTYSFYTLTSRKSYITINGNGGFYVMTGRVDKFVSDTQRFFNLEIIEPSAKN